MLNELEKPNRIEIEETNEYGYHSENLLDKSEIKNNEAVIDKDTLDREEKELERLERNVNSSTASTSENLQHSENSANEKQIDPVLTQTASGIDLPPRKQSSEPNGTAGSLNNLIRRMTGFGEKREQADSLETKSQIEEGKEKFITDREDESKLEIPAFLRRQAN